MKERFASFGLVDVVIVIFLVVMPGPTLAGGDRRPIGGRWCGFGQTASYLWAGMMGARGLVVRSWIRKCAQLGVESLLRDGGGWVADPM